MDGTGAGTQMPAQAPPEYPALNTDINVDVAVVGGGIAGVSIAAELTRAGRTVVLLEADRFGPGVTGQTTAKVSALHGAIYHRLSGRRGAETAATYAADQGNSHAAGAGHRRPAESGVRARGWTAFVFGEAEEDIEKLQDEARAAHCASLRSIR
jgi:glycine/D-amino acid oxidase-like deaminating enzyme